MQEESTSPEQLVLVFLHVSWRDIRHDHLHVQLVDNRNLQDSKKASKKQ